MAGTVTETQAKRGPVGIVTLAITADASDGSVPDTDLATKISGKLLFLETNPGGTAPTSNYDITVEDADGHDVLEGVGANRHTSNTEKVSIVMSGTEIHPAVGINDTLAFKLANNSENSATVSAKVYYEGEGEA